MTSSKNHFEDATSRLEVLVEEMEAGGLPLERTLEKFSEGVLLIKKCRAILDEAEKKVKVLMVQKDEEILGDFQGREDDTGSP